MPTLLKKSGLYVLKNLGLKNRDLIMKRQNNFYRMIFLTIAMLVSLVGAGKDKSSPSPTPQAEKKDAEAIAKDSSLPAQFKQLQNELITFSNLKVDYSHTRSRKIRGKNFTTKGYAIFAKPNKFRWVKKNSEILFDGKEIYQYSPVDKSAVKFNIGTEEGRQINRLMSLVLNFDALEESYTVAKFTGDKDISTVELKPKDKKDPVKFIRLKIDRKAKVLTGIFIQMPDSYSEYVFTHHETKELPGNAFDLPTNTKISSL